MTDEAARHAIGANKPPLEAEIDFVLDGLKRDHAGLWGRAAELLASYANAPAAIPSDLVAGQMAALRKMLRECGTAIDAERKTAKGWYDKIAAAVQSHFGTVLDPLRAALVELERRDTAWLSAKLKAEEDRRRAELAEARQREEAARLEAEETARQQKALADMAAAAADDDQRAAIAEQQAEAEAEAQRQRDAKLLASAEVSAKEKAVAAPPSQVAKSTSGYGATSSLRQVWSFRALDRDKVDLEKLRPYLDTASLEKAVREAIRKGARPDAAGKQPIAGVEIFLEQKSVNR